MGDDYTGPAYQAGSDLGARGLLGSAIARHMDMVSAISRKDSPSPWDAPRLEGQWLLLVHMTMVTRGMDEESAAEWLAEELQDRYAAMAD